MLEQEIMLLTRFCDEDCPNNSEAINDAGISARFTRIEAPPRLQ
jgi:hypothetical protein